MVGLVGERCLLALVQRVQVLGAECQAIGGRRLCTLYAIGSKHPPKIPKRFGPMDKLSKSEPCAICLPRDGSIPTIHGQ